MTKLPSYGMPDDVVDRLQPMDVRGTYKYRNADKWREYMKLYMRGYRRKQKEQSSGIQEKS